MKQLLVWLIEHAVMAVLGAIVCAVFIGMLGAMAAGIGAVAAVIVFVKLVNKYWGSGSKNYEKASTYVYVPDPLEDAKKVAREEKRAELQKRLDEIRRRHPDLIKEDVKL